MTRGPARPTISRRRSEGAKSLGEAREYLYTACDVAIGFFVYAGIGLVQTLVDAALRSAADGGRMVAV